MWQKEGKSKKSAASIAGDEQTFEEKEAAKFLRKFDEKEKTVVAKRDKDFLPEDAEMFVRGKESIKPPTTEKDGTTPLPDTLFGKKSKKKKTKKRKLDADSEVTAQPMEEERVEKVKARPLTFKTLKVCRISRDALNLPFYNVFALLV